MGKKAIEVDALAFPMGDHFSLGCESGSLRSESFEEAFGIEVDALLVGGDDDFGKGGAFCGGEKVFFGGGDLAFDFNFSDFEVFFLKIVFEGGEAGQGGIGKRALNCKITSGGNGAAKGDEFSTGSDVGIALVAAPG